MSASRHLAQPLAGNNAQGALHAMVQQSAPWPAGTAVHGAWLQHGCEESTAFRIKHSCST
jgi:hypothetical protein